MKNDIALEHLQDNHVPSATVGAAKNLQAAAPSKRRWAWIISLAFIIVAVLAFIKGNDLPLFLLFFTVAFAIHEAGHWGMAALVGVPVKVYAIGIGPCIASWQVKHTRVEIRLLPLLGYVEPYALTTAQWQWFHKNRRWFVAGVDVGAMPAAGDETVKPAYEFIPRPCRVAFFLGGVLANLLAAALLLWWYGRMAYGAASPGLLTAIIAGLSYTVSYVRDLPVIFLEGARHVVPGNSDHLIRSALQQGPSQLLFLLSITNWMLLGFNLLPIPPLDGFQIMTTLTETVLRRDLSSRSKKAILFSGLIILGLFLLFNVFVMLRDLLASIFR